MDEPVEVNDTNDKPKRQRREKKFVVLSTSENLYAEPSLFRGFSRIQKGSRVEVLPETVDIFTKVSFGSKVGYILSTKLVGGSNNVNT